jgi:hypothetical protein
MAANAFVLISNTIAGDQTSAPSFVRMVKLTAPDAYSAGGTPFDWTTYLPKGAALLGIHVRDVTRATGVPSTHVWEYDITNKKLIAYVRTTGVENATADISAEDVYVTLFGV